MSPELLTLLMFGLFFILLAIGIPLAWTTLTLAIITGLLLQGTSSFSLIAFRFWDLMQSFSFVAIPLFVFMANMLSTSGIADDLYDALYHWLGPLKGGLGIATVAVCTVLAAMVGTVGAGTTIMGLVALPAMLNRGYDKGIACGAIVAGGTLGVMIPPSIMFIIYGVNSGLSVGKLFIGGIFPGLLLSALFMLYIGIRCSINPSLGPPMALEDRVSLLHKVKKLKNLVLPTVLIIAVLGSIYLGLATPGEAAGVGAFGAIVCTAIRGQLSWKNVKSALYGTMKTVGLVLWIGFGAYAFIGVYSLGGGADFLSGMIASLPLGRWGIFIIMQLILIVLGMVLDVVGIVILLVPIFTPIVAALGFDPLWFGIIFNINLQIAFLSPPFGYAMFYLKGVAPPSITMTDIYRCVWPFMGLQLIALVLVTVFPQIAVWLPNNMMK